MLLLGSIGIGLEVGINQWYLLGSNLVLLRGVLVGVEVCDDGGCLLLCEWIIVGILLRWLLGRVFIDHRWIVLLR